MNAINAYTLMFLRSIAAEGEIVDDFLEDAMERFEIASDEARLQEIEEKLRDAEDEGDI